MQYILLVHRYRMFRKWDGKMRRATLCMNPWVYAEAALYSAHRESPTYHRNPTAPLLRANLLPGNDFGKANDAGAVSGAGTGENAYEMSQNLLALARLSGASKVASHVVGTRARPCIPLRAQKCCNKLADTVACAGGGEPRRVQEMRRNWASGLPVL